MSVRIRLLGDFSVSVDRVPVPPRAWARRDAASLVKLLALSRDRWLLREQVIEALWPELPVAAAAPRLHKAAHFARRALGDQPGALVLRNDVVALLPDGEVRVDLPELEESAAQALAAGTADAAADVLDRYPGPLLPGDVYESWTAATRDAVRVLHLDLLRRAGRWVDLLAEEPADEQAHLALARASADRGDVRGALRQFERMDRAFRQELGTTPSRAAEEMRARLEQQVAVPAAAPADAPGTRLFGRRDVGDTVRQHLERAEGGRGGTLLFTGAPGVGKTAVLGLALALARRRDWRTGSGTASAMEGPWPYSSVLEALGDLCRQHPALLDGLDDIYRLEIERALSGRDVTWSGESGHQRLFVAAAELMRLAAAGHGLLLVVDDIQEADEASLRLLHYLSRCAVSEPVLLVLAHRRPANEPLQAMVDSLVGRGIGSRVEVEPLPRSATRRLLADRFPALEPDAVEQIWIASAGLPFTVLDLARQQGIDGVGGVLPVLPLPVLRTFERAALLGMTFSTDELLAVSGVDEDETYRQLEVALAGLLVHRCDGGYCFRHPLVRDSLVRQLPARVEATARRVVAEQLAALGAPPGRVAHQFLAAGLPARAVPFVTRAVETAGALGAYRDALTLVDAVRAYAGPDELPTLLARRGDLLLALGDPAATAAYRDAVAVTSGTEHRLVRARLARASSLAGDLRTARVALLGLDLEGDAADAPILLAQGNLAYFSGDMEAAWDIAAQARDRLQAPDDPWQIVDLVVLQGLIAHQRGEWSERFRLELRRTEGKQALVTAVFDAHLCVAEYLLYGPVPYDEVITETEDLRRRATQAGALRGVAFATALIGEAALLMGDFDRAERELLEAVDLHRDSDASAGEAHSLQRLAELRLAQGDRIEAQRLLQQALPLARWSVVSKHLLQRVYGTMIEAAPDPVTARAVVDRAEATLGEEDACSFCSVMLAVPATIACADVGDVEDAHRHLEIAERSVARWELGAWQAAAVEARAHVARAEGRTAEYESLLREAARQFAVVGHARDSARCVGKADQLTPAARG
jgi:DNA-binding SARP family transcriptional activator/tetratricopeptide (TPR) repeat protein